MFFKGVNECFAFLDTKKQKGQEKFKLCTSTTLSVPLLTFAAQSTLSDARQNHLTHMRQEIFHPQRTDLHFKPTILNYDYKYAIRMNQ